MKNPAVSTSILVIIFLIACDGARPSVSPLKISTILDREIRKCRSFVHGLDDVIDCAGGRAAKALKAIHGGDSAIECLTLQIQVWRSLAFEVARGAMSAIEGDLSFARYVNGLDRECRPNQVTQHETR